MQVVSSLPIAESQSICQRTNNQLAAAVKANPGRLAGFAALPMGDGTQAAAELQRTVTDLGFLGALVANHAQGNTTMARSSTRFGPPQYD